VTRRAVSEISGHEAAGNTASISTTTIEALKR
jgi:hypothetical protein